MDRSGAAVAADSGLQTHGEATSAPNTQLHLNAPFKPRASVELRMSFLVARKNKTKKKLFSSKVAFTRI